MRDYQPLESRDSSTIIQQMSIMQGNQNRFGNAFLQEQLNQKSSTPHQLKRNNSFGLLENLTSPNDSDLEPLISQGEEFLPLSKQNTIGLPEEDATIPDTEWMNSFFIDIFHEETNPLVEDATPTASDLYEEIQTCGDEYSEKGTLVTGITGSIQEPEVTKSLVEDPLYIGGKPQTQDIAQGNFGDCYFLAALHQIVLQDPNKITDNLTLSGNTVSFRFQTKSSQGKYKEETISTNTDLLFTEEKNEDVLTGAKVFTSEELKESAWWIEYDSDLEAIMFCREDRHEAAAWVAYLEKLYALFAQKHGQYGDINSSDEVKSASLNNDDETPKNMAQIIDGGEENFVYQMFYGAEVLENKTHDFTIDKKNKIALGQLLELNQKDSSNEMLMLTVWASSEEHIKRLGIQVDECLQSPDISSNANLEKDLVSLQNEIQAWKNETKEQKKDALIEQISKSAESLANPQNQTLLHQSSQGSCWRKLLEMASNVQHIRADASNAERNIYSLHAYSVMGAIFRDEAGKEITPSLANLDIDMQNISLKQSSVKIYNPHHTNEPDVEKDGPQDGIDDGVFEFTLDQYFHNFTDTDFAEIKR